MGVFNSKNFNSEVFGKYLETVPRVKQNAFLKAGILRGRPDLKTMLNCRPTPSRPARSRKSVPPTCLHKKSSS